MKLCIRPFGIGVEDVDTEVVKVKAIKAALDVQEKAKWFGLVAVGLALVVGEVVTRHTADGLTAAANAVADVHDDITELQKKNDQAKIDHAYGLMEEHNAIHVA